MAGQFDRVHQTVGVETVLSTGKYRKLIRHARGRGFEIRLIYVLLKSADLQRERIRLRVEEGGHFVPDEKVRSRRLRSFRQIRWFCMHADRAYFFDNSTGDPELIATREQGTILVLRNRIPADLARILKRSGLAPALGL
jgi:predicted ABC-type ATPase